MAIAQLISTKASSDTRYLSDTKVVIDLDYEYQLAYISEQGDLIRYPKRMNLTEAIVALGVTGAVNAAVDAYEYNRTRSSFAQRELEHKNDNGTTFWGVYASSQRAAKALAVIFGGHAGPEVHASGMYAHYHDKTHTFHIWYGGKMTY